MVVSEAVELEQRLTVPLGLIFDTPADIERQGIHLALLQRFMMEMHRRNPERNGDINLNYAANEWVRKGYHQRFSNCYSVWKHMPCKDVDVIYKEVTGYQ